MARYFQTFGGSVPYAFNSTESTSPAATGTMQTTPSPIYGTHSLRIRDTSNDGYNASWYGDYTAVPVHSTGEYLMLWRVASANASPIILLIGPSSRAQLYPNVSSDELLASANAGSGWASFDFSINTWYWMRFRKSGGVLTGAAWEHGSPEPTADLFTTGNVFNMNVNGVLIGGSGDYQQNAFINYVSIATDGDVAYRPYKKIDGHVRDGGVWKPADPLYVKDAGVWKDPVNWYARDAGVWKDFYG